MPHTLAARIADLQAGALADHLATRLVGRGPGLTPLGDDILAGALVTLRALGADADPLAHAVLDRAHATTFVSAALLWHAARGECVPELARLLTTLGSGEAAQARAAVLRLGHTSGAGLLQGVELGLALAIASERRARRLPNAGMQTLSAPWCTQRRPAAVEHSGTHPAEWERT